MPHTPTASSVLEDQLAQLGYTITTVDNPPASAANPDVVEKPQLTNGPRRVHADLRVGNASATVFIAGWDDADGLVLTRTRAGVDTIRTDDTPADLLSAATGAAAIVHLDGTSRTVIEVHPGTDGRYYVHDPLDRLRFGPDDSYATPEGARAAAAAADPDAVIIDW